MATDYEDNERFRHDLIPGGYSTRITSAEENEWYEYIWGTKEFEDWAALEDKIRFFENIVDRRQVPLESCQEYLKNKAEARKWQIRFFRMGRDWYQELRK